MTQAEDITKTCCQNLAVLWPTVSDDYQKGLDNRVVKLVEVSIGNAGQQHVDMIGVVPTPTACV